MKSIFKRIILCSILILSFAFISACSCDKDSDDNITPTFESFEIVGEDSESLSSKVTNDVTTLSSSSNENPFGEGKETIEEKIDEEIEIGEQVIIDYTSQFNEYIYTITKIKNPSNKAISSITISGVVYTSNLFEKKTTSEQIIVKIYVGNKQGINTYALESIKYIDDGIKDITITGDVEKTVKVGTINNVSYTLNNIIKSNNRVSFSLRLIDDSGIISATKGKATAILYDGESIVRSINLNVGIQTITFDSLDKSKVYQYAVVVTYDKLDGNGKKNYILVKNVLSVQEFTITKANTVGGNITVDNIAVAGETVIVTTVANSGYRLEETYYIKEGQSNKFYFENSFVMPLSNVTIYATFGNSYAITKTNCNNGTIAVKESAFEGETINVNAIPNTNYTVSEMYYIEENSNEKHYFVNSFKMPNKNIEIYVIFIENIGDIISIYNKEDLVRYFQNKDNWNKNFKLFTDIDLSNMIWTPVGDENTPFSGTFDGSGHKIINLKITSSNLDHIGFFGKSFGATIKNLGIENININCALSNDTYVGGLVGYNYESEISSSYVTGNIKVTTTADENDSLDSYAGGLVGYNYESEITNCYVTTNVMINTTASGTYVSNDIYAGGLAGYNYESEISYSYATGDVSAIAAGTPDYAFASVGGLVGYNYYGGIISNSYATGDVSATASGSPDYSIARVGGLIGDFRSGSLSNNYIYNGQIIKENGSIVVGNIYGTALSMQTIWQYISSNYAYCAWNNDIWNLSLSKNPTLK